MSPVFKWQNWSMPFPQVAALVFFTVSGWRAYDSIMDELASIKATAKGAIMVNHFAKWQSRTEKMSPPWQGADMDAIRE